MIGDGLRPGDHVILSCPIGTPQERLDSLQGVFASRQVAIASWVHASVPGVSIIAVFRGPVEIVDPEEIQEK